MIVLDTNVVSELLRPRADAGVSSWVEARAPRELFLTAVTAAELRYGVGRLPRGRRRTQVAALVDAVLEQFTGRVLAFDHLDAPFYAEVVCAREAAGTPIDVPDALIAATCLRQGAPLATRNGKDFAGTGVVVLDPWGG